MRLAILGGSFDPVHKGHLALAEAAHSHLNYDKVLLVPSFVSPHKLTVTPASPKDRLKMLNLAIQGMNYLSVDDCELAREGVSYTIDTLKYLFQFYAHQIEGKIGLIIGSDLAAGFSSWKESARILEYADLILGCRPGDSLSDSLSVPHIKLENKMYDVSSTLIRLAITRGSSWTSLVPDSVYHYIEKYGLYKS